MSEEKYLEMQRNYYDSMAMNWSLENKNPVVGSYHHHNNWTDYDTYLFKNFETQGLIAIEYGVGPGRNIIKFHKRFKRIDGVDIGKINIEKAKLNLQESGINDSNLYVCNGDNIPTNNEMYDVVFSVICLQHICCHSIRYKIFEESYRVLKPNGRFCFQMGYGGRMEESSVYKIIPKSKFSTCSYYDNVTNAKTTNGLYDVSITNVNDVESDLVRVGFRNFLYDIRPTGPGDSHKNWVFIQVNK